MAENGIYYNDGVYYRNYRRGNALLNTLGKKKFKKSFIWLILIIACGYIFQLAGTSDLVKNKLAQEDKDKSY